MGEEEKVEEQAEIQPEEKVEEKPAEEKAQEKEKAKRRLSDRNKELTWKLRETERQLEAEKAAKKEVEDRSKLQTAPKEEDFDTFESYKAQQTKWDTQKEAEIEERVTLKVQTQFAEKQTQLELQKNQEAYNTQRTELAKEDPKMGEYELVVTRAMNDYGVPELQNMILNAKEYGPKMVKHLGTHPDALLDIALATPQERFFQMGKLQAKLEAKPVKKISSAPDPVRSGKASAQVQANPANETQAEYNRRMNFGT